MDDNDDKIILNLAAELSCADQKSIPRLLCNIKGLSKSIYLYIYMYLYLLKSK